MRRRATILISATSLVCVCLSTGAVAAETAAATASLQSITGTPSTPIYNYTITLHDTGTTNIGTFWFGWVPGKDFLDSVPSSVSNPTGWTDALTGSGNSSDGTAIQWVAGAGDALTPGGSLSGFAFSTLDSPAQINGFSNSHPTFPVETSFVYSGAPFSDSGFEFQASPVPEPATCAIMIGAASLLGLRRPRRSQAQ